MDRIWRYVMLILLLCAVFFGFVSWLGNRLYPAVVRLDIAGEQARFGFTKFIQHWKAVDALRWQYDQCREDVGALEKMRSTSALLAKENNELKQLVRFVERQRMEAVTSRVYGHGIPGDHQAFFDAGTDDGVEVKHPVVGTSGNVIAIVSSVEKQRSVVTFLSSPDLVLPVITTDSLKSVGVTQGGRGNEVVIGFIPQQTQLRVEEVVLLPSEATTVQRELYLGYIDSVTTNPSDIFQSAIVIISEPFGMVSRASVIIK